MLAAIPRVALGVLGVADGLRLPKLLVATTLSAFTTSSPELTVSSMAALAGKPEIGLGDALGSNVVNIGLILGLALLFGAGGKPCRDQARFRPGAQRACSHPGFGARWRVAARGWRGNGDIGLATLLGSNLFNGLAIVGVTASIHPIHAPPTELAVTLGLGVLTVLLVLPRAGFISRRRGGVLLSAYAAYVVATLVFY